MWSISRKVHTRAHFWKQKLFSIMATISKTVHTFLEMLHDSWKPFLETAHFWKCSLNHVNWKSSISRNARRVLEKPTPYYCTVLEMRSLSFEECTFLKAVFFLTLQMHIFRNAPFFCPKKGAFLIYNAPGKRTFIKLCTRF